MNIDRNWLLFEPINSNFFYNKIRTMYYILYTQIHFFYVFKLKILQILRYIIRNDYRSTFYSTTDD